MILITWTEQNASCGELDAFGIMWTRRVLRLLKTLIRRPGLDLWLLKRDRLKQRQSGGEERLDLQMERARKEGAGMVLLTTKIVQRASLFVAFGGLVTTFITTFLPLWKTMNSELNEMENWYEGLWHTCIFTEEVGLQCKAFESLLALPPVTLASRILMCVSIATGFLGVLAAFFGLDGVEIGAGRHGLKKNLLIVGGILILVSGATTLAPVSLIAYVMVLEFWDEGLPDVMPRWEYGEAMFSAWFSGLLLVIGGSFLFVAVCMGDHETERHGRTFSPNHGLQPRTQNYQKTEVL